MPQRRRGVRVVGCWALTPPPSARAGDGGSVRVGGGELVAAENSEMRFGCGLCGPALKSLRGRLVRGR
jgi:hypothetical protein